MFVDRVTIFVRAGDGGAGSASLHSEPFKPRGGPDGGDGGRGGDVVLRVDPSLFDLSNLADRPHRRAGSGGSGGRNNRHGADGDDLVLDVPDGTVVRGEHGILADLVGEGASAVVARSGRGGRGNASLASPRNRVPRVAEKGEPGEERRLELELRLVADIGLVGLPNAGKSTLLSRLTAAKPKIAAYPFTTLAPNLGVAGDEDRYVVADVPGLIEGAHEGRGLGLEFLRHVSRCRALVFVLDLTGDPVADLATVRAEIEAFDPELAKRRSVVVGTKGDLLPEWPSPHDAGVDLVVSGQTGDGVEELRSHLHELMSAAREEEPARTSYVVMRPAREPFSVAREGERFRVSGPRVERWVAETDLEDPGQVVALQRRLVKAGVERRLAEAGARRGDEVMIGVTAFEFIPEDETSPQPGALSQAAGRMVRAMATKREMCEADDAGWNQFLEMVGSMSPEQLEEPGYSAEGWSVKDVMAHIGNWQAEACWALEQIRSGTYRPGEVDVDGLNARFHESNRDLPLSVVRAECWSAHTRMLTEWNALSEPTPQAEEWFYESGPGHYQEHLPRLREWVEELRSR